MDNLTFNLGDYQDAYQQALEQAAADRIAARIWDRDHTVWQPDPDEISNRLGWLDIAERMRREVADLQAFTQDVIGAGIDKALVLGMGGSSLAPEVLSKILGPAPGFPVVDILDSTDPEVVSAYTRRFAPAETLYIVSTKSGSTVETLSFFKHFYNLAQEQLGDEAAGAHFAAVTDPGSKLVDLAQQYNFRRTFLNDPEIGGRYSALSFVGLLPAALLGLDLNALLDQAVAMAEACQQAAAENPGLRLGLALSTLAKAGRDKLTLRAPQHLEPFGDWAEQLIAESTGKAGAGILPVVGEPPTETYGDDRTFVYLGDVAPAREPNILCSWEDDYAIGAQFFLWEFATAVAGYGLGIQPFNQPNVESAKKQARQLTERYIQNGELPQGESQAPSAAALEDFLAQAQAGDYIALQAYLPPNRDNARALEGLRQALLERYHLATTLGYGPRFLHSTGQLHKGDDGSGLFIQFVTPPPQDDLAIPLQAGSDKSEISFGVLKAAQALGDAQALREAGRRVLALEVSDPAKQIQDLSEAIHG